MLAAFYYFAEMKAAVIGFMLLVLVACSEKNGSRRPAEYNDFLVGNQIRVVNSAEALQNSFDTYNPEDMQVHYKRFITEIDEAIRNVSEYPDYRGSDDFRLATGRLLEIYRNLADNEYHEAMELLSKPDSTYMPEDEKKLEVLYRQIDRISRQATAEYRNAQQIFARANGLEVPARQNEAANAGI